MAEFAARTGAATTEVHAPRRYLWTDAFAVCNFLELYRRSGDARHRASAVALIGEVHRVLGRYRADDARRGWISGLDEEAGRRRPTAGGLRIGKPRPERGPREPYDERREWDRDGQYFHYLTKWMHALCRAAVVLGAPDDARAAAELAAAAFKAFVRRTGGGAVAGIYWKMSTDLSHPQVPATRLHDALDGMITLREIVRAAPGAGRTLDIPIEALAALCRNKDWTIDDPLGLGGLLFDACRLGQLADPDRLDDLRLLEAILRGCASGLVVFLAGRPLERSPEQRLAFRELGLAIGLRALPLIAAAADRVGAAPDSPLRTELAALQRHQALGRHIAAIWLAHAEFDEPSWQAHEDINAVMLATALAPDTFLSVGK